MSLQSTDQIADLITRIRNAIMVGKNEILVPTSKLKVGVVEVLKKNGYVAEYRSADDLARGIDWILHQADYQALSESAIAKVRHHYTGQQVAMQYTEVYQQALAQKHFKL